MYFEGGAKNPLKSITMKSLMFAWDAQFRVASEVKVAGQVTMACFNGPGFRGGLAKVK